MAINETQVLGLANTFGYYFYVLTYNVEVDGGRERSGSSRYVHDERCLDDMKLQDGGTGAILDDCRLVS
jgi:hypothetical protein